MLFKIERTENLKYMHKNKIIFVVFLLSVYLFFAAAALAQTQDAYNDCLLKACLYFNRGDYNKAAAEYLRAEKLSPQSKEVLLNLAIVYKDSMRYQEAIAEYKKLLGFEENAIIYLNMAEAYYLNSMPEEAIRALEKAKERYFPKAPVFFWLARCYEGKDELEKACESYAELLKYDDNFALAHLCLGRLCARLHNWDKARQEFEKVRELDPSITEVYAELAEVYFQQTDYENALRTYRKAQAVEPDDRQIQQGIEKIYQIAGDSLKKAFAQKEEAKLAGCLAVTVPLKKAEGAPLLRVHIAAAKNLKFKCASQFFLKTAKEGMILFKGEKNGLYQLINKKGKIHLFSANKKIKDFNCPISIIPASPEATILLFAVSTGKGNYWASRSDVSFRGLMEVSPLPEGYLNLINMVNMEEYLYGVLPSEMPYQWPQEALKAQAIAARSEAFVKSGRHKQEGFDFCSQVHCQAYNGAGVEKKETCLAVDETCGEIAVYKGKPIDAVYSNNCGGYTENNIFGEREEIPYLSARQDAVDPISFYFPLSPLEMEDWLWGKNIKVNCNNPGISRESNFRWMRLYSKERLEQLINKEVKIGRLAGIILKERNVSGHLKSVEIIGSEKKVVIDKESNIRKIFGDLRSSMFNVDVKLNRNGEPVEFLFYGGGWGHAVGLCQAGAAALAQKGFSCEDILKFYYKDIEIKKAY